MDELEALKQRRIAELQQQGMQQQEQAQLQDQIDQLENIVKQVLTKDALSRLGNIKAAHPEKAIQLLVVLAQYIQQNQLSQINDVQLKEIIRQITPKKKEFKINKV
ncbi:MAG: DNA-binding protein [Nanoarchaeota archaeon]